MKTLLLGAVAAVAAVIVPGISLAATYAYVNQDGEVRTTESATANAALMSAPGIDEHSGVMLINDANDEVVGDNVAGV